LSFEICCQYIANEIRERTYLGLVAQPTDVTTINLEEETIFLDLLDGCSDLLSDLEIGQSEGCGFLGGRGGFTESHFDKVLFVVNG